MTQRYKFKQAKTSNFKLWTPRFHRRVLVHRKPERGPISDQTPPNVEPNRGIKPNSNMKENNPPKRTCYIQKMSLSPA